jgi:hypothetical protein
MGRLLFLLTALVACASGPARVSPQSGGVRVERGMALGWGVKRVVTKTPPSTLVAEDGTVCRVSTDRYKDTKVGRSVSCDWQLGNPAP